MQLVSDSLGSVERCLEEETCESRSELEQLLAEETRNRLTLEVELSQARREASGVEARVAAAVKSAEEARTAATRAVEEATAAREASEAKSQALAKTAQESVMLLAEVLAAVSISVPAMDLDFSVSLEGGMMELRKAPGMVRQKVSDLTARHGQAAAGESLAHALALLKHRYPDIDPSVILDGDLPELYEEVLIEEMRGVASSFVADVDFSLPPS